MSENLDLITGEFIELRKLKVTDAEITLKWRSSVRASLLNRAASSLEEQVAWITRRPGSEQNYIIQTRQGLPVGMLSLINIDLEHLHAESGRFLIGEEEAARGIPAAVESMKLLYDLAFKHLKLQRVYGTVASDNTLMIKWQKYLGMKEEGRLRRHYFIDGRFQDAVCLGLLAEEYEKDAKPRMMALMKISNQKH